MAGGSAPLWPTQLVSTTRDGRSVGVDNSVWLYRAVPLSPVADAKTDELMLAAAMPVYDAISELSQIDALPALKSRKLAKGSYREAHMLLVNVPRPFEPMPGAPNAAYLAAEHADVKVMRRLLVLGVKLRPKVAGESGWLSREGLRKAIDSVVETISTAGVVMSDYDADFAEVSDAMRRAGLNDMTKDDRRLANAWWNHGRYADTPTLVHGNHVHVFESSEHAKVVARIDIEDCTKWRGDVSGEIARRVSAIRRAESARERGEMADELDGYIQASLVEGGEPWVAGEHTLTFASVEDYEFEKHGGVLSPVDGRAQWASTLIQRGAAAISLRGLIEPSAITREQIRRQRKRILNDIKERQNTPGKQDRSEQEEMYYKLTENEEFYASFGASATLIETSVIVAFDGNVDPSKKAQGTILKLSAMDNRQRPAQFEMMLCSSVRANPHRHDLPGSMVAASGLPSMSQVGDETGILLGFTEMDRQPAYLSATKASSDDQLPMMLVVGGTGSGKTVTMLSIADQFARSGTRTIVLDPKMGSAHDPTVLNCGGQVYSLDDLSAADGVFDPFRFAPNLDTAVSLASSMLMTINPWGIMADSYESAITIALRYGATQGATCTGQALLIAKADGRADPDMVDKVLALAEASTMFRACIGVDPQGTGLRVAAGLTLIKVGDAHLNLPAPGDPKPSQEQRIALALVRMMVFGSAMALAGDAGGALCVDEAWLVLSAGRAEMETLGRLARSQNVLPILFTQRVTDALNAKLQGFISRGLILSVPDRDEALAACELFKLEATPERIHRMTTPATKAGGNGGSLEPDWDSQKALRNPVTRKHLRGSIGIYFDLAERAVPVEIKLSERFLYYASTTPDEVAARRARDAEIRSAGGPGAA